MIERQCEVTSHGFARRPGLIIVSQDLDIGAAIEELLSIWLATDAEEWVERVGFVPV